MLQPRAPALPRSRKPSCRLRTGRAATQGDVDCRIALPRVRQTLLLISDHGEERAAAHDPEVLRLVGGQQHGQHEVGAVARGGEHAGALRRLVERRLVARVRPRQLQHRPEPEHRQRRAHLACGGTDTNHLQAPSPTYVYLEPR